MALKHNVIVNYISQIYNGLIGIFMMPFYLKLLGTESYGLIAFFTLLQSWFYLLDVGLSQTLTRETVRYKNQVLHKHLYQKLYRYINGIFITLAVIAIIVLSCSNTYIVKSWLKIHELKITDVMLCLQVMFFCAGLRCVGGIYRGIIQGFEHIVWISSFNIIINTLRFIVIIPVLFIFGKNILVYFYFQLLIAVLEFTVLCWYHRRLLAQVSMRSVSNQTVMEENEHQYFRQMLKFAVFSACNFLLWMLISQSDKLLLSSILSLKDYAYYSIAILLAGVILLVATPISNVLIPRMTALYAQHQWEALEHIYHQFSQWITVLVASIAGVVFWNAETVVYIWSHDFTVSHRVAHILQFYIVGNVFLVINAFTYYIQYAHGQIKKHFYGNILLSLLMLPLIYFVAHQYYGIGTAIVWLLVHGLWFLTWTTYINACFIQQYIRWSWHIVMIIAAVFIFSGILSAVGQFLAIQLSVFLAVLLLAIYGGLTLAFALCIAPASRAVLRQKLGRASS